MGFMGRMYWTIILFVGFLLFFVFYANVMLLLLLVVCGCGKWRNEGIVLFDVWAGFVYFVCHFRFPLFFMRLCLACWLNRDSFLFCWIYEKNFYLLHSWVKEKGRQIGGFFWWEFERETLYFIIFKLSVDFLYAGSRQIIFFIACRFTWQKKRF